MDGADAADADADATGSVAEDAASEAPSEAPSSDAADAADAADAESAHVPIALSDSFKRKRKQLGSYVETRRETPADRMVAALEAAGAHAPADGDGGEGDGDGDGGGATRCEGLTLIDLSAELGRHAAGWAEPAAERAEPRGADGRPAPPLPFANARASLVGLLRSGRVRRRLCAVSAPDAPTFCAHLLKPSHTFSHLLKPSPRCARPMCRPTWRGRCGCSCSPA